MEVIFYRTKQEFVRDTLNNLDMNNLPERYKKVIDPLRDAGWTKEQLKEQLKAHLEASWEGQGKHPINQFFKPENKNSDTFSIEKNIGKILRENNEILRKARSGIEVQKDAQGNVISYGNGLLTEEQIGQQARSEAYNARRSFIEFMFSKANDLINTEAARQERRPATPEEVEQLRRLEQKSQQQYENPIGPELPKTVNIDSSKKETKSAQSKKPLPEPSDKNWRQTYETALQSDVVNGVKIDGKEVKVSELDIPTIEMLIANEERKVKGFVYEAAINELGYATALANMRKLKARLNELRPSKSEQETTRTTVEPPKAVADYKNPIGPKQPKTVEAKQKVEQVKTKPIGTKLSDAEFSELRERTKRSYTGVNLSTGKTNTRIIYAFDENANIYRIGNYLVHEHDGQFTVYKDKKFEKDATTHGNPVGRFKTIEEARKRINDIRKLYSVEKTKYGKWFAYLANTTDKAVFNTQQEAINWAKERMDARYPELTSNPTQTKAENIEEKVNAQSNAVNTIKTNQVVKPEVVGVKHADVINVGTIAAGLPEVAESTKQVLNIKDDYTLTPATSHDVKGAWFSENKRYIVEPIKGGKSYRVTMLDHISPYDDKLLPKTMVGIVSSLEQAQLAIREHAFYQRRLFEINNQKFSSGQGISEKLQSQAPVLTPQQTQQIAVQVEQASQQQPSPPVTNPQVKAQMHPRYNDIIRGLRGLGIPDAVIKDLTNKAIDNLGTNAKIVDIVMAVLNLSQGRALQVAQSNQTHTATANAHTEPVTLKTASQVVIMPTDAGTIEATGTVIPQLPVHSGLSAIVQNELARIKQEQYNNKVKNIGISLSTLAAAGNDAIVGKIASRYPRANASTLATLKALSTFNAYNSVYSLPNGQSVNGKSYRNSLGYVIQQSGIGKWRLYNPASSIISVTDNEQEAIDKLIKHYYGK